jgi:hypothetical protein
VFYHVFAHKSFYDISRACDLESEEEVITGYYPLPKGRGICDEWRKTAGPMEL